MDEVLADKIVAVAFRAFLKGRDLWDLFFLVDQKGISLDLGLVARKVADYGHSLTDFRERLAWAARRIADEGPEVLAQEMARFMPQTVFTTWRDRLDAVVRAVQKCVAAGVAAGGGAP